MKKIIVLLLLLLMVAWGCGSSTPMATEDEPADVATAESDTTYAKSRFQSRYSTGGGDTGPWDFGP